MMKGHNNEATNMFAHNKSREEAWLQIFRYVKKSCLSLGPDPDAIRKLLTLTFQQMFAELVTLEAIYIFSKSLALGCLS